MSEGLLIDAPIRLNEHALQAHWFAGDFGRNFLTRDGVRVQIVQFGTWNHEAGPDFAEASVSFDGAPPVKGCIELDTDWRDWERHGHATNEDYESVILHLFTQRGTLDFFTRTLQHRNVPQVLLDITALTHRAPEFLPEAKPGRCVGPLRALPEEKVREILLGSAHFRLQRKAASLALLTELHGSDEALYQSLAAALGYKSNKLAFTLISQRLPLRLALRAKAETDALLFGLSGFLNAADLGKYDATARIYLRRLWEQWWPRRAQYERLTIGPGIWTMSGQRPANHPQRRLGALAQIIRHWPKMRALKDECDPAEVRRFFHQLRDEYWDHHFTLTSKPGNARMALVGESRVTEILANVLFPLAVSANPERWSDYQKLPAALSNRRVEIAATRLFGESVRRHELLRSVAMQQGLLQIYEDFCMQDSSDCQRCRFPEQLARW
ncbi:MAG: hypothetical protein JWL90_3848 [Chthoniobacteraceae bacterium]|nr:hypothetical protein [Chthoniobacteraceae bacterium]